MSAARVSPRLLAVFLTIAASSWTAAIFFAPLARATLPRMPIAGSAVNIAASFVCHQRDERSFHLKGERLPVCGRCTGLYVAGAIGALAAWLGVARVPARTRRLVVFAAVPTAITLALEWSGAANPGNLLRATAALPLGAVAGWLFVRMLRVEEQPGTCAIIT
jgi:uncharacterized membrane protein